MSEELKTGQDVDEAEDNQDERADEKDFKNAVDECSDFVLRHLTDDEGWFIKTKPKL